MPIGIFWPARDNESGISSPDLFPNLPGLDWNRTRTPIAGKTSIQESFSGVETRVGFWTEPRWRWLWSYEVLRANALEQELQVVLDFFLQHRGSLTSFLVEDPSDNHVQGGLIGTGDGSTAQFQLSRSFQNMYYEPIRELNGDPTVYIDGVEVANWTVSSIVPTKGLLSFSYAPASGAVITADFYYFFRVRFVADEQEFANFMHQLWELQELELISVKGE